MSTVQTTADEQVASNESSFTTLRRGFALTPEIRRGLGVTLVLALVATGGRVIVPVTIQQTIDRGFNAEGGIDSYVVQSMALVALAAVALTTLAAFWMTVRIFHSAESGLATLRIKAFRHVHDLSVLTQNSERRGSLVARVSTDVDALSQFVHWGLPFLVVAIGQLALATLVMAIYSWQLTLAVWVVFLPLFVLLRTFQRKVAVAYRFVREHNASMLNTVAESVVAAPVVRAYGIQGRTEARIDESVTDFRRASTKAQALVAFSFSLGEVAAGIANAAVIVLGVMLGVNGDLTAGQLVAFLFLVTLFVMPIQLGTEVLNDAQNAVAGWRRVLAVLDTATDVPDPGVDGQDLPVGALDVRFNDVSYAYPDGPVVLEDVNLTISAQSRVAVVGETGSGKTTFAKLLTRLMDPSEGHVVIGGVALDKVRFGSLRSRVGMVPQEGFLRGGTIADNVRQGNPSLSDIGVRRAFEDLDLADWLNGLAAAELTNVGERGESLSVGERQLVAIVRAYVSDPDVLVLDEATSSVDPATEQRLTKALDGLTRGRTSVTIAHRLSTAEAADVVVVFDRGRIVEVGSHLDLVTSGGIYSRLHEAWVAHHH